jgi:hypothetical protein
VHACWQWPGSDINQQWGSEHIGQIQLFAVAQLISASANQGLTDLDAGSPWHATLFNSAAATFG